jgi:ABC-2 type transport system permease protein
MTPQAARADSRTALALIVRARDALAFEWTKLRSVRSNGWTLLIAGLVSAGATAIVAQSIASAPARTQAGPISPLTASFLGYAEYAVLPATILGVLAFTSEFSTGLIRTTFVALPRRWAVLAAKAAVTGAIALLAGEALAFGSFFLTQAILSGHRGLSASRPGVAGAVLAAGLLMPACVLAGLGLGAIIRHTAGGIAAAVGVIYFLAAVCLLLPSPWRDDVGRFTMAFTAYQVTALHPQPGLFSPAISLLILIAWPAAILLAAALALVRRDI